MENQKMVKKQHRVTWMQIVSLYTSKQMIFIKTFQKVFELDLILKIMNKIDRYLKENKKIKIVKIKKAQKSVS